MQESHVLIYKEILRVLKQDIHDTKIKELISLAYIVLSGHEHFIPFHVERAIDAGAIRSDFLKIVCCIIGDKGLFSSIMVLLKILDFHFEKEEYTCLN